MPFDIEAAERSAEDLRARLVPVFQGGEMRADINRLVKKYLNPAHVGIPYTVVLRDAENPVPNVLDWMNWGPRFGLSLLQGWYVVAGVGFHGRNSGVSIKQIQGVASCADALCRIRWQELLVEVLIAAAARIECEEVVMVRAEDGKFYPLDDLPGDERARCSRLRHYNGTAERLGFVYDPARRLFVLPLRAGA